MNQQPEKAELTKRAFIDAFWLLAKKQGLFRVTVSQVAKKAGYHRGTFYVYFEDINDLILCAENEIIEELKEKLYSTPPLEFLFDSHKTFERIIRLIDEYDDKIFMLLSSDGDPNFLMRLRKEATVFVDSLLSSLGAELKVPSEYLVVYISSAVGGLLGHWYENGKPEPLEDVIAMGHQMLKSGFYGMIRNK